MDAQIEIAIAKYVRTGNARLDRWMMYSAYDAQRLRENVWRDIRARLQRAGADPAKTRVIESEAEFLLVNTDWETPLMSKV